MPRAIRWIMLVLMLLVITGCTRTEAQVTPELTGDHVADITRMFLRNHYSRVRFDDAHATQMLDRFIQRYDPGHYYFLQSDVDAFRRQASTLDDRIRRNDIALAFTVHQRYLDRMRAMDAFITASLGEKFDLESDDLFAVDRSEAPYPGDVAEARGLFRKRLKLELLELVLSDEPLERATERLRTRYRSSRLRFERFSRNDVVTTFLNAFTTSYDPHSNYMSPDDLENFNISMRLSLEGIGATLRWEDGYTIISSVIPGGAAAREGTLQPEDRIMAVGQGASGEWEDVTNLRLIDVVKLIRGERGTTVRLSFLRKGKGVLEKRMEVAIGRDMIVLKEGEAKLEVMTLPAEEGTAPQRIGVISLPSFYVDFSGRHDSPEDFKSASRDVARLLDQLLAEGTDGVVLDLRNNGGGGLDEAVSTAGLFLPPGPVLMVKDARGQVSLVRNPHSKPTYRGPLVVMINRYSASASEIVAGALQDYGRAVLVGDRATFGKGTVQNIITLPKGLGALKTTVAKFYRPGSSSTQNRGVEADIVLPSLNNYLDIGESAQDNALPWDTVQRASFQPWSDLDAVVPALRASSKRRVAASEHFARVRDEVRDYLENRKNRKEVSLRTLQAEFAKLRVNGELSDPTATEDSAAPAKPTDPADPVLTESLHVLGDYIRLLGGGKTRVAGSTG